MLKQGPLLLIMLGVAACSVPAASVTPAVDTPGSPSNVLVIVDADGHGAIVLSGRQGSYLGVHRDGTVAWRVPVSSRGPDPAGCAGQCPNAILSGSVAASNSISIADPAPQLLLDGKVSSIAAAEGHKRRVLSAAGADDYLLAVGDAAGNSRLEQRRGSEVRRLALSGSDTTWKISADGSAALAVSTIADGNQAQWFTRSAGWWQPAGPSTLVRGGSSCVSPDGRKAVLLGQSPIILDQQAGYTSLTDLRSVGACGWSLSAVLIAEYAQRPAVGVQTRLRLVSAEGIARWAAETNGESAIAANPVAPRVSYVADGVLFELDSSTTAELRQLAGVHSARYTSTGELIVARANGTMVWLP